MNDREKIAARIRALLAKTVENGCTEDEAIAAAGKAAEMLARYNLTVDEVQMRASAFSQHTETFDDDMAGQRLWKVADGITHLTSTRYWTSRPGSYPVTITFFGFDHEVAIAEYLLAICALAMRNHEERLQKEHVLLTAAGRRRRISPFLDGMADRLRLRIRALKPVPPTGTGLVVLHDALVAAAMPVKVEQRAARSSRDLDTGYQDGQAAGDRVALNRGVTGAARPAGLLA